MESLNVGPASIVSASVSGDGKLVATVFESSQSRIYILNAADGGIMRVVSLPGYERADHTPASLLVNCAWSEDSLMVISTYGHVVVYPTSTWLPVQVRIKPKLLSSDFSKISVFKSELAVIASSQEIVILSKMNGVWELGSGKSIFQFSQDQPQHPLSMDIHPSGSILALCVRGSKNLLLLGLKPGDAELVSQLRRTPKDAEEENGEFQTPVELEDDSSSSVFPTIINQLPLGGGRVPIACAWSKYGDNLVIASSDNFLSIWNVPSRTIATVAVSETADLIIRNVKFVNDVLVAVAVSDSNRVLFIDVDEGVLYETDSPSENDWTKNPAIDFSFSKGGSKVTIFRPGSSQGTLNRWSLSL